MDFEEASRKYAATFTWKPLSEGSQASGNPSEIFQKKESIDDASMRFTRFLVEKRTQEQEYSSLTVNHEAAGNRGREKRVAIEKHQKSQGLTHTYPLAVNPRGRPITLIEPTDKAYELLGIKREQKKGPGGLAARAADWHLMKVLKDLEGAEIIKEGILTRADGERKQVDRLIRWLAGVAWSCEIAASWGHEATNALFCLTCSDIERHVVVCVTKKVKEAVLRSFARHKELRDDTRIRVVVLWEAMNPEFWRR